MPCARKLTAPSIVVVDSSDKLRCNGIMCHSPGSVYVSIAVPEKLQLLGAPKLA